MYRLGVYAAAQRYGVKLAGAWGDFADDVRHQAIGDPAETWKQFRKGTLMKPGHGLLYKGLPHSPGEIAASLAWPVMGSILLARNSPETGRGELVGDFIARSAGSLVGGPLAGAAGQIGGGMLMAPVGRAFGRAVDRLSPPRSLDESQDEQFFPQA